MNNQTPLQNAVNCMQRQTGFQQRIVIYFRTCEAPAGRMPSESEIIRVISEIENAAFSPDKRWSPDQIRAEFHCSESLLIGITKSGEVFEFSPDMPGGNLYDAAGYASSRILLAENTIDILRIAVAPPYRRQGFAKKMLAETEKRGSAYMDFPVFCLLEVSSRNEGALHLYRKSGYEILHIRKRYYRDNSDALIMRKTVRG